MKSKRFVAFAAAFAVAASAMTGFTLTASAEDTETVYNFSSLTAEKYSKSGASVFDGALTLTATEDAKPQTVSQSIATPLGSTATVTSALMSKQLGVKLHLAAGETVVEYYCGCDSKLAGKDIDVVVKSASGATVASESNSEKSAYGVYKIAYTAAADGDYTIVDSGTSTNRTIVFAVAVTNGKYDATVTPEPSTATTAPGATQAPTAAPQATVDPNAASDINITRAQGWQESAYITWTNPTTVSGYNVYVKKAGGEYTKLDKELIRFYGSYYRADALGLAAGTYQMKVVPVVNGAEVTADAKESEEVTVSSYIREGFAFDSHSSHYNKDGVGAYKNDGTLKDGAKILYITDKNKDTVTLDVVVDKNKGTVNTGKGLVDILSLREKNNAETTPLAIRMIGQVEAPAGINSSKYAQIKSTSNITFEGVGDDATTYHWSLLIRDTNNIEVRNLAVMEFYDDGISLDTDNYNDWVHNCDIFYGQNRGGDQKKGDGSLDVKAGSDYCTFSYNHFWDSGKCSLCGMKEDSYKGYHITYFGNWFDHSDSRHPRVRGDQVHVYNNYYDGVSKYGAGACTGGSIFVEKNVFRNCVHPVLTSMQGTDIASGKGTFSSEDGGSIKMFDNAIYGGIAVKYSTASNVSSDTDAYLATSRDEQVPATYVAKQGGAKYSNFDTASTMYSYNALETGEVVDIVQKYAGRVENGDFTHEFDDAVDDALYDRDPVLGGALQSYKSAINTEYVTGTEYPGTGGEQPTPRPTVAPFDPDAQPTVKPGGGDPIPSGEETTEIWRASDNASSISAGTVLKADWLKLIGNGVEYKASNQTIGGVALTGKVNAPSGQTPPTLAENGQNGSALQFIPDKDGTIKVYFKLNNGKTFYITDENSTVVASYENTTGASKYTTISADVVENVVYYAFAEGSNAEFWAAEYSYTSDYVDDDPEETPVPDVTQAPATQAPATQAPATQTPQGPTSGVVAVGNGFTWSADNLTAGDYTAPFNYDNVSIGAGAGVSSTDGKNNQHVTVDSSNNTFSDGTKYTQRLKTNGKSVVDSKIRVISFTPDSDCTMTLRAMSSNSTTDRNISVKHGSSTETIALAGGEKVGHDVALKANEEVIIYSEEGAFNIFGFTLTPTGETPADPTTAPATSAPATSAPATQAPAATAEPVDPSGYVTPATSVDVPKAWSADSFTAGTYTAPLDKDGLYIGASDSVDSTGNNNGSISIDANSKTIGTTKYTQRIKTGGLGDPTTGVRVLYFKTNGDCDLLLHASSSNSTDTRDVVVAHGNSAEHLNVLAVDEYRVNDIKAGETVYIYSAAGGLNVYGIQLVEKGYGILDQKQLPLNTRVTFDAFAGTSITGTCLLGDYVKVLYTDGSAPSISTGNKVIGGYSYTRRLGLGGKVNFASDGVTPKNKAISVIPAVDGTLYVDFGSTSGGAARTLTVKQGSKVETGDATSDGAQMAMVVKGGEEVFIYGENDVLAIFGILLIEGGGSGPDSTPAPLPGTVKAVTESTVWTAAIFGVEAATDYTEKTLSEDETIALVATAKNKITVDGTKRIKMNGGGREIEIKAGVAGTVTVEFAHASSTATDTRTLSINQNGSTKGSEGVAAGETKTATASVAEGSVIITADAAVNIMNITFTPEGGTPPEIPTSTPKPTEKPADTTPEPTQTPDTRTCVKITATYENGILADLDIDENFKVSDITTPENTDTTKTFYWESLESMKPVAAEAAPADPTTDPADPTEQPTPVPVDTSNVVVPENVVDVANGVVWSADDFEIKVYTENISNNGLYIGASDSVDSSGKNDGSVEVDQSKSSKTVGGTTYANRIKTGGKGDPTTGVRCLYFAVTDDCTMLLDAVSSSGSADRDIVVIHGDTVEHLTVTGTPAQYSVEIKKDENVVIYSTEGGLNVYGIKLTTGAAEGGEGGTDTPAATAKPLPKDTLITFDAAAEGTGTSYKATTVFGDYLTIISNGSEIKINAHNKTIGGVDYASRLQLGSGGSGIFNKDGSPKTKAVSVTPAEDGTLTVAFASGSSDVARAVAVKQGNSGTEHSETADGNGNTISVEVTAGTPVYIYSQSDAVNVYGIILN